MSDAPRITTEMRREGLHQALDTLRDFVFHARRELEAQGCIDRDRVSMMVKLSVFVEDANALLLLSHE